MWMYIREAKAGGSIYDRGVSFCLEMFDIWP